MVVIQIIDPTTKKEVTFNGKPISNPEVQSFINLESKMWVNHNDLNDLKRDFRRLAKLLNMTTIKFQCHNIDNKDYACWLIDRSKVKDKSSKAAMNDDNDNETDDKLVDFYVSFFEKYDVHA